MIRIYVLDTEKLKNQDYARQCGALPFGESEKNRLLAINNSKYRYESLGGLTALMRLTASSEYDGSLEIVRSPSGKPAFADKHAPHFGISHSRAIAAAALGDCSGSEIGFDLEVIDGGYDVDGIAERFFSDSERQQMSASADKVSAFFSIWTAKEARAKLSGRGLSSLLSGKDSENRRIYEWQGTVEYGDRRIAISICTYAPIEKVIIYTDSEDSYGK